MYIHPNPKLSSTPLQGIEHVTLASSKQNLQHLSVWQQKIGAGCSTPPHKHDCEEVILCTQGQGELHINQNQVFAFGADCTITIPANILHQIINTGDGALSCIAVFSKTPVATYLNEGQTLELPWHS